MMMLAGLSASFAVPLMSQAYHRWELNQQIEQFENRLNYARISAINLQDSVKLMPSQENWASELLILLTDNSNVIKKFPAFDKNLKINFHHFPLEKNYLEFDENGLLDEENGSFVFEYQGLVKRIVIDKFGRVR